ncbi:MAG: prepilin-type N-terminal cleavage/methylation domain-containing protein [Proteobacteria bacterium]|nr:prepilin-type N-terminal cleavage/methylation domain-containing protein [Pseudomonadota bacterium]
MGRTLHYRGFTLIEVMIVCAIVAVLAAVALPSYFSYIQRSKIIEATTALSDVRQRMEQKFLDSRTYADATAPKCSDLATAASAKLHAFTLSCSGVDVATYTVEADGVSGSGMDQFKYSIDQADAKKTLGVDTARGWSAGSGNCWVTRKDGTCG